MSEKEKDSSWYEEEIKRRSREIDVLRGEYGMFLLKRAYPAVESKVGKFFRRSCGLGTEYGDKCYIYYHVLGISKNNCGKIDSRDISYVLYDVNYICRDSCGKVSIQPNSMESYYNLSEEISRDEYIFAVKEILDIAGEDFLTKWHFDERIG